MDDLVLAVRQFRTSTGDTLEAFATRVGLSTSAIANYEKGRVPNGKALYKLAKVAGELNRPDLSEMFGRAFQKELGTTAVNPSDELQRSALSAIHQNRGPMWLEEQLVSLIREARNGAILRYPEVFDLNHVPDQKFRTEYLVGLLIELRMKTGTARNALEKTVQERREITGETYHEASLDILLANPLLYARYKQEEREEREEAMAIAATDSTTPVETKPIKRGRKGGRK